MSEGKEACIYPQTRTEARNIINQGLFALGADAVQILSETMKSRTAKTAEKIKCAEIILERICGKVGDSVESEMMDINPHNVAEYLVKENRKRG